MFSIAKFSHSSLVLFFMNLIIHSSVVHSQIVKCSSGYVYSNCAQVQSCPGPKKDCLLKPLCLPGCVSICPIGTTYTPDFGCVRPSDPNIESDPSGLVLCDEKISKPTACRAQCQPTCNSPDLPIQKCTTTCKPGCLCNSGYFPDPTDKTFKKCIKKSECAVALRCNSTTSTYTGCSGHCQKSCDSLDQSEKCYKICKPGCKCNNDLGYYLDKSVVTDLTKCVLKEDCPKRPPGTGPGCPPCVPGSGIPCIPC